MGVEIERKFLLAGDDWRTLGEPVLLRQGYLSSHPDRVVRVRVEGATATMTVKSRSKGATRGEWEYCIPLAEANELLDQVCERPIIEKFRRRIEHGGHVWEVDEFLGVNEGLHLAEIELGAEDEAFDKPAWIGEEVTDDSRYFNSSLQHFPYSQW